MLIRSFTAAIAALALILPQPAHAWGFFAHRTIAKIALANITPHTRTAITRLLRSAAALGTPQCDLKSLADASVWPDCVRRVRLRWGYTAPWHYQTVDICQPFTLEGACANGNCVSAQIDRNAALLADKDLPDAIRLEALAFLVHFTGDIHMPLHSGSRDDRGGNDVLVAYGIVEGRMNLHWLWDGPLAERAISDGEPLVRRYSATERTAIATGNSQDWSRESWALSRSLVYPTARDDEACGTPLGEDERAMISNEEIPELIPHARLRITQAGLRLAKLLDTALAR